jgi:hypothetical protein
MHGHGIVQDIEWEPTHKDHIHNSNPTVCDATRRGVFKNKLNAEPRLSVQYKTK